MKDFSDRLLRRSRSFWGSVQAATRARFASTSARLTGSLLPRRNAIPFAASIERLFDYAFASDYLEEGGVMRRRSLWLGMIGLSLAVLLTTAVGASARRTADPKSVSGTLNITVGLTSKAAYQVIIANFERVYPNVTVQPTYLQGGPVT